MKKNINRKMTRRISCVVGVVLSLIATATLKAEDPKLASGSNVNIVVSNDSESPNAVLLSIHGKCEYSEDGVSFTELTDKHVVSHGKPAQVGQTALAEVKTQFLFNQGTVVRTGENSRMDIFFRRIGTTVRVQADTEVKFEKMARSTNNGAPVLETLLDLRKGRIFTVVRSLVAGSTFEIRNAAGRSIVEGAPTGSMGRYIITADGTQIAEKSSLLPIKLIGEKGITIIAPGEKFAAKEGKTLSLETPEIVSTLIEFDELHALAEATDTK